MGKFRDAWSVLTGKKQVRSIGEGNITTWYGNNDVQVIAGSSYEVSPEMAMKLAAVYRCTSIVSGTVASLPLQIKKKVDGSYWKTEDTGRLASLLALKPNERQTSFDLIRNAVVQILNQGNAYIYPEWRTNGDLGRLVLLSPNTCTYDKLYNRYIVSDMVNRVFGTFEADEMIHLRNLSTDGGYLGVSTLQYAAKVLRIASKSDDKSEEVYSPGGTRRGFVTGGDDYVKGVGMFQDNELKNVADRVSEELKSGKQIMNLPAGTGFSAIDLSPADSKLLENKQFGVLEICRFYGVHPDKVFAGQSTNYKASEMSQVLFMSDTLQQILKQFSLEFTAKLFVPSQYERYRIEFSVKDFYNTDLMTLATVTEKNIQAGLQTINEARRERGYPPVPGGDELLVSANLMPVGKKIEENPGNNG
ncbi:phage portal protein [Phocaeicola coprophilus]|uniref:phage portal protein n=1 Tax=Phocaeicola coprophilus TaxID=387090 RepID=UPI001E11089C|nr:phage portal protein [Phocaeicola coprophilus]HJE47778.1 phage portal protein [Phocaeicola coprophilus]